MANERTINVTGYGELHAKPDTVRLTLTVERTDADYAAAVRATEQCCAAVTDALVAAGVGEKHIRALSLRTQPRYETSADENGARTRKFAGYAAVRRIRAEFSADAELTGRILDALAGSGAAPEIATEYLLSDREALRGELRAQHVGFGAHTVDLLEQFGKVQRGLDRTHDVGGKRHRYHAHDDDRRQRRQVLQQIFLPVDGILLDQFQDLCMSVIFHLNHLPRSFLSMASNWSVPLKVINFTLF